MIKILDDELQVSQLINQYPPDSIEGNILDILNKSTHTYTYTHTHTLIRNLSPT